MFICFTSLENNHFSRPCFASLLWYLQSIFLLQAFHHSPAFTFSQSIPNSPNANLTLGPTIGCHKRYKEKQAGRSKQCTLQAGPLTKNGGCELSPVRDLVGRHQWWAPLHQLHQVRGSTCQAANRGPFPAQPKPTLHLWTRLLTLPLTRGFLKHL